MSYPLQIREMIARQMAGGKRSSKKGTRKPSAWNKHVKSVSRKNPNLSFKQAVKKASSSYKGTSRKSSRKTSRKPSRKASRKSSRKTSKKTSRRSSKKSSSRSPLSGYTDAYWDVDDYVEEVGPEEIRKRYQKMSNENALREEAKAVIKYGAQSKAQLNRAMKFLEADQRKRDAELRREEAEEKREAMKERRLKAYQNKINRLSQRVGDRDEFDSVSHHNSIGQRTIPQDIDIMESFNVRRPSVDVSGFRREGKRGQRRSNNDNAERARLRELGEINDSVGMDAAEAQEYDELISRQTGLSLGQGLIGGKKTTKKQRVQGYWKTYMDHPVYEIKTGRKYTPSFFSLAMLNKAKKEKASKKKPAKKGSKKKTTHKKSKKGGAYDMMYM